MTWSADKTSSCASSLCLCLCLCLRDCNAAAAIAAGGERHQMLLSCSHLSDGTHISCHVMTCQNNGSRNYHTTEIITASPARYLNFRGTSNWFYQWRSKTYFLGASP